MINKQQLSHRLQQRLSPRQIQQIKLLELSSLEIENRINRELEENPLLEEVQDQEIDERALLERLNKSNEPLEDYLRENGTRSYDFHQNHPSHRSSSQWEMVYSESESFHEYLLRQLKLKELSEEEIKISEYIIGNIDDDGYIRQSHQTLSDGISCQFGQNISVPTVKKILQFVQGLDPPGVGASDLQECLLLQLCRKKMTSIRWLVIDILKKHFGIFAKKHYDNICKIYNISEKDLRNIIREITILNPKPGNMWGSNMETKLAQITPDFIVEIINGKLFFTMTERNIPKLKVNERYSEMLFGYIDNKSFEKKEAFSFVRRKIDSALWFIDAIKYRNVTLYNTMLAVIEIQRDFFLTGEEQTLKPMKLKDVSELCGYDISTVSRATINKYVQTDLGIYPLRFFFSEAIMNEKGEEISTREIKIALKSCVENENKKNPFTDDILAILLKEKGYYIARRTVAKYREQLNIPVARLRKEIG